ncbi:MAG: alpha/beta hydrolase [Oceanospirillaceae bacterium]|nr:alpha/beta hydrolase [Oceanospirillaceae bacterium]MBT14047.1 alpha/beta hydrolase [Oceanospirillaceae bacterium]|tara:strand:- start:210017 stop:210973 length:957 start_codon:yes stop_codon:yes gene_type:complete
MNKIAINALDGSQFDAWLFPHERPKATVQILHGMAEHCLRYTRFAEFLQHQGYRVITHNHRGHGGRLPAGHYADPGTAGVGGWALVIDDALRVQDALCETEPRVLLGHSMGSFIAQSWAMRYGDRLSGLILSGSARQQPAMLAAGLMLARALKPLQGHRHLSALMNKLSFGAFNRPFRPNRSAFDWLSRDPQQVDAYIRDPHCGHLCSLQLWCDMLSGLRGISHAEDLQRIPSSLPVLIFGGDQDPVGAMGKGLPALAQEYQRSGHNEVTVKLYTGGRHEMLNETNYGEVQSDLLYWIDNLFVNNTKDLYDNHHQPHL